MDGIAFKQRVRTISQPLPASNISFRHPGYDDPEDILFTLPRLDSSDSQAPASGVLHGTALLACQIIANNAFDGYLTTDRGGNQRVSVALDGVLMDDDYWFVVPDTDVYPVVPRFQEWQFPHGHLEKLAAWDPKSQTIELHVDISTERPTTMTTTTTGAKPPSMLPPAVPAVPRCVLTNNPYAIQKTHIVPVAQSKWFQANSMKRYGDQQLFINTEQNMVPIRHDLHKLWDDHVFALVPKRAADGNGSAFVVHVLNMPKPPLNEFANEWHNTPVQKGALDQAGKAFLLAKFAQAVFMLFKPFIAFSAVPRNVATFQARADNDPRFPAETKTAWTSPSALSQQYSGGGSRSASASADSRKRSRSQISAADPRDEEEEAEARWYTRNVRARLSPSLPEKEEAQWYALNVLGKAPKDDDEEDNWYDINVLGKTPGNDEEEDNWHGINAGEESPDERRGRTRMRRPRRARSEHTVDTLPSLTDTSAVAADLDEMDHGVFLAPSAERSTFHASKGAAALDGHEPLVEDAM